MIVPAQVLRALRPIEPFCERSEAFGMTFGVGPAGYDIRIAEDVFVSSQITLASTIEKFNMPDDLLGVVHDKSTWARRGLFVQNTVIEPGWRGFLTLELTYNINGGALRIEAGSPIAQVVFHRLEDSTDCPYGGKYQDQTSGPQRAILSSVNGKPKL